jgi:hypothetical protein
LEALRVFCANPTQGKAGLEWATGLLFRQRMVVVADGASDLPFAVFLMPKDDELGFSNVGGVSGVMEGVVADLDGSVVGDGIDLKGSGDEFAGDFAADVVLDGVDEDLTANGEAGLVVVELEILGNHRAQRRQVAVIVGVEQLRIEGLDGLEERIGSGCGLGVRFDGGQCQEEGEGKREEERLLHTQELRSWDNAIYAQIGGIVPEL